LRFVYQSRDKWRNVNKEQPRHGNGRPHRVFHAKEPTFGFGPHPRWPEGYRLVAEVDAKGLEEVFGLTNDLGHGWTLNPGVRGLVPRQRSTSVGDVVVGPDGRIWRCEPIGWSEIQLLK